MNKLILKLDNTDDREGCVMVTLEGPGAAGFARYDQSFGGSSWETAPDLGENFAYCMPVDNSELVDEANEVVGKQTYRDWKDPDEAEKLVEVELDLSEYCEDKE